MEEPKPKPPAQPKIDRLLSPFERNQQLNQRLSYILEFAPIEKREEIRSKIRARAENLANRHSDHIHRRVYHILHSRSSAYLGQDLDNRDYEGDDSVVKFVDDLAEEYGIIFPNK